jgi:hypothetical protein
MLEVVAGPLLLLLPALQMCLMPKCEWLEHCWAAA